MAADNEIDLLSIQRGTITAPAGCGKTHLIAEALTRHDDAKPIMILTHTNAGVIALRGRLDSLRVPSKAYPLDETRLMAGQCASSRRSRSGPRMTPAC